MKMMAGRMDHAQAERQLSIITTNKQKITEKLSSGYRINRSADDAAGLVISEKMRKQIRGLTKASKNIQDGISLIQTADGALNEMHDILQRMNELAVQGANDPNTALDRDAIRLELNALKKEMNRISKTTQFNTHTILMAKQLVEIDAEDYAEAIMEDRFYGMGNRTGQAVFGKKLDFSNINSNNKEDMIGRRFYVTCSQSCGQRFRFSFTDQQNSSITLNGSDLTVEIGIKDAAITNGADIVQKINTLVISQQANFIKALQTQRPSWNNVFQDTIIGHANALYADGANLVFYSIANGPPYAPGMGLVCATDILELEQNFLLQVSDRPYAEIALNLRTINSATLGIGVMDLSSFESAGRTMGMIQKAIVNLSDYRSYLGAMQNRLEKAISIVDSTQENTQSAESKLRDADMAEEMLLFSKSRILEMVGQAMVAHNNQNADSILQLLA